MKNRKRLLITTTQYRVVDTKPFLIRLIETCRTAFIEGYTNSFIQ